VSNLPLANAVLEVPDDAALAAHASARVARALAEGVRARGAASLAVPGGRTPASFLSALGREPLTWARVVVTLTDERWVDPGAVDSNERLVRRHLLRGPAGAARFVGLKNDAPTASVGEATCEAALATVPQPFDVVVLGMGADGHTASLFPQAPQLRDALDLRSTRRCIAIDPPAASHARMSLTLRSLLASRRIVILIAGAAKRDVLRAAMLPGPVETLPIRGILHQPLVPVEVCWSRDARDA